jgi:hypothetical protein
MAQDADAATHIDVEIITFEYRDIYDLKSVPLENAVEAFIEECKFMNSINARFSQTAKTISFAESRYNDKTRTVMMVMCKVTDELVDRLKQGIAATKFCNDSPNYEF